LVQWLLQHGGRDNSIFLLQLDKAHVVRQCGCGCASIDFSISGKHPQQHEMTILADYQWQNDAGQLFGAFVFAQDGLLAGLDLWSIDGQAIPTGLPQIERLVPYASPR
jgi:hypothetical protein